MCPMVSLPTLLPPAYAPPSSCPPRPPPSQPVMPPYTCPTHSTTTCLPCSTTILYHFPHGQLPTAFSDIYYVYEGEEEAVIGVTLCLHSVVNR